MNPQSHNKNTLSIVARTLKALEQSTAIIGRMNDRLYIRPSRIPSALFEEITGNNFKLLRQDGNGFVKVFAEIMCNDRIMIINFEPVLHSGEGNVAEHNDDVPCIDDVAANLNAIEMMGDIHIDELEFLTMPPTKEDNRQTPRVFQIMQPQQMSSRAAQDEFLQESPSYD